MSEGKLYLFLRKLFGLKTRKKQLKHHFIKDNLQGHLSIKEKDGLNQEELGQETDERQCEGTLCHAGCCPMQGWYCCEGSKSPKTKTNT